MERMLSRCFQQVCSKCNRYLPGNLSTTSSSAVILGPGLRHDEGQSQRRSSQATKFERIVSLKKCDALYPRLITFPSFQTGFMSPNSRLPLTAEKSLENVSFIRGFCTEKPHIHRPPSKAKAKSQSAKSPISWKNLIIIGIAGGALILGMRYVKEEKAAARKKAQNRKVGKAKLGGEWTLTDHNGKLRSSQDFRGQWLLIYFGFTNCPDICPEEIEKIVNVIDKADGDSELPKVQPIIITVDPLRDTPEALKEYCSEFSPRLLGFSGTEEQIEAATRAYRVYYSAGPKDEDNDYIVDHSIISYLVNPDGEFTEYFGQNKKADEIYSSMKLHIMSYDKKKSK